MANGKKCLSFWGILWAQIAGFEMIVFVGIFVELHLPYIPDDYSVNSYYFMSFQSGSQGPAALVSIQPV